MALVLNDRVKETTTTTGTGTVNLAGAETGFETFVAGIGNSNTTYYAIAHQTAAEFEVGLGTVTDASPDTLARTTVISSSNSDSAVNFSSGTKDVFCTMPASKAVHEDASGNVTLPGTLDVDGGITVDNITIDGTEIDLSSGNLTIDVAGDIVLDCGGGDINLQDDGTQFGSLENDGTNFIVKSERSDADMLFKVNDGGSSITALTIDSSEAGAATFNKPMTVDGHTGSVASIFEANGNGDTVPVQLKVKANNGTISTQGLYGNAGSASGDNTICLGNSGSSGLTVNNSGNVSISGSLSKGSGSFKIDHPLEAKKDTHYLIHSFVEGPQADNIYRGKVDLINGTATINIDTVAGMTEGTFVALNTDVQCFTSNESSWDAVKGSISGNVLTIESQNSESTATVSWMVIGERQDQHMIDTSWTDENGKVIIEPLKPIEE
tara:strand:+ start:858 stop:2168 length:1311 start_codon:yes stop_codon:yes gene_type:complete